VYAVCQKWELGIQSFYSSQTYSMQLKKKWFSYKKPVLYTFQEGYFFINFLLKNWLLKKKQERVHAFYINHCTFPSFTFTKVFCV